MLRCSGRFRKGWRRSVELEDLRSAISQGKDLVADSDSMVRFDPGGGDNPFGWLYGLAGRRLVPESRFHDFNNLRFQDQSIGSP